MFKRKALEKLKYWKEKKAPKYSVLLEGARRVGKSTITRALHYLKREMMKRSNFIWLIQGYLLP